MIIGLIILIQSMRKNKIKEQTMNILFFGDICGKSGVDYLMEKINLLKKKYNADMVIANAENVAEGQGLNYENYQNLTLSGVNLMTMGNHTWKHDSLENFIDHSNVIRPVNDESKKVGSGHKIVKYQNKKILVMNALGRVFMNNDSLSSPFTEVDKILHEYRDQYDYSLLDFHAQATSEKIALAHYFDGRIDAVVGTHTHVQTNDDRILPKKTLYISDVGMTGPLDGVIGQDKNIIINNFLNTKNKMKQKNAEGKRQLNGVLLTFGKERKITKIKYSE